MFTSSRSTAGSRTQRRRLARGITLVELLVFIVVVSVGLAGVLAVYNTVVRRSADPLVAKQMTAVAEALLEEVQLMPFTFCDPDDANALTANSPADCAGGTPAETRGDNVNPFDNVADYNGLSLPAITDIAGNSVPGLAGYSASINVTPTALGVIPASEALQITVTVTGPGGETFALSGFRTRFAPRATP
jgi:MSHA pilin protein MshD